MSWIKPFNTAERPLSARRWSAFNRGHPAFDLIRRDNIASGKWPKDKFKPLSEQYEDLGLDKLSDFELEQFYPGIPFSMIPATHHISRILEEADAARKGSTGRGATGKVATGLTSDFAYQPPDVTSFSATGASGLVSKAAKIATEAAGVPTGGVWGGLLSQVAKASVADKSGGANYASSSTQSHGSAGLPDIRHIPGSRTYIYNDPAKGSRSVTPFADEIPGFDWHRDRNLFNFAPGKMPKPSYREIPSGRGPPTRMLTHYVDHRGSKWFADYSGNTGPYHGWDNLSLRGRGQFIGCQAIYSPEDRLITSGPQRGTFDYTAPGFFSVLGHRTDDVNPHKIDSSYRDPDLTTVY